MELLRALTELQHERGYLDREQLVQLAKDRRVALYRLEGLVSFYPHFRRTPPPEYTIKVCRDVTCRMAGCAEVLTQLQGESAQSAGIEVCASSCLGRCDSAVAATVNDVPVSHVAGAGLAELIRASAPDEVGGTSRRASGRHLVDPWDSEDEHYGTVLQLSASLDDLASTCVERLTRAGLRGLGGAGFPTGRKWDFVRHQKAETRYVVCNADESEPGTFKDRHVLAELPHLVIEGMVLAGLTIGAETGIVYLRHEYGPEGVILQQAIDLARERGILGENAAGSGRSFDIEIFVSPGGYILGEETALLEALEDKRGEPRTKPPYPGEQGLWGQPTLINNVETLALAASIIHHGPEWWASQGKPGFEGLKFVCVSGDVQHPGVHEVPVGTTVADLIEMAGGVTGGELQAFLPGGASSSFLRAEQVETPLDFEAMKAAGSILGTGAVIIISDRHDLFDLATNITEFFRSESCGKCVPCRLGTDRAVQTLNAVSSGSADAGVLQTLPELGETLEQTSICGLGQVALHPVLSLLKHFPDTVPGGRVNPS